jgi:hypothetical protein
MKRSLVFFYFFLGLTSSIYSQISLSGKLVDPSGEPVAYATIQIKDDQENTLCYGLSDDLGLFNISCLYQEIIYLKIDHLNYATYTDTVYIQPSSKKIARNVTLQPKENKLSEVLVRAPEREAKLSGDTIRYNLKLNTTGTERNLGEIIDRMPGLSVNDNGDIIANGKKIENLLVDGKAFFGDNHKLATENFKPEMVKGLSLIQNYQSNNMFEGKSGSQERALNIELDDTYKGRWTGDISALGAWEERYSGKINSYFFGKKVALSWLNNANNTGLRYFSIEDYVKMSLGSQKGLFENDLSNAQTVDDIPAFLFESSTPQNRRSEFSALNYLYQPSEKLKIRGYSMANTGEEGFSEIVNNQFISQDEVYEFTDSIESNDKYLFLQNHFELTWQVDKNYQLNYQLNLNPIFTESSQDAKVDIGGGMNDFINSANEFQSVMLNQKVDQLWLVNENTYLGSSTSYANHLDEVDRNLDNSRTLFDYDTTGIVNKRELQLDDFQQSLYFARYFGEQRLLLESAWTNEQRNLENIIASNAEVNDSTSFRYKLNHLALSAEWLKSQGDWQYKVRFNWQNSFFSTSEDNSNANNFLPDLHLKYAFSSSHYIKAQWAQELNFVELPQLNDRLFLEDYRNIQRGTFLNYNDFIKQSEAGFNYFNFDLFNGLLFFFNSTYRYSSNSFVKQTQNNLNFNEFQYTISEDRYGWVNLAHFEYRANKIQHKVKSNFKWIKSEAPLVLNSELRYTQGTNFNSRLSVISQYQDALINYEGGISYKRQQFVLKPNQRNDITRWTPFIGVNGRLTDKLIYRSNLNYENFIQTDFERQLWILDAEVDYQLNNSGWGISIEGRDLINLTDSELVDVRNESNILSTQVYQRLRGYLGLRISYKWK